ncbi:MAG TPA: hypothetical protein VK474_07700, partial [Chthoniobacterales bacterium]|nr:hypothetical protein [Chthoniobacterales bacterium]
SITEAEPGLGGKFALASIARMEDSRNRAEAEVSVPAGGRPALVSFTRPYFRGYQATVNGRALPVISWLGLVPAVELPAGTNGRLVLVYRPWWLTIGTAVALASGAICILCLAAHARQRRRLIRTQD